MNHASATVCVHCIRETKGETEHAGLFVDFPLHHKETIFKFPLNGTSCIHEESLRSRSLSKQCIRWRAGIPTTVASYRTTPSFDNEKSCVWPKSRHRNFLLTRLVPISTLRRSVP